MDLARLVTNNPGVLLKKNRMKALFNDVYQNDLAKVNVLMMAYEIGIVNEMRSVFPLDTFAKSRLVKVLVQQYSIIDSRAIWAVDTWCSCFSKDIARSLEQFEAVELATEAAAKLRVEILPVEEITEYQLQTRDDYDAYYINPTLDETSDRIYVPCGLGKTDYGFFIYGIRKARLCTHPNANVYALIYNYLVRNSQMTDEDMPHYLQNIESLYDLDYRSIYRITIILLQMIKNNYMAEQTLEVAYTGEKDSFRYAVGIINNYAELFCRLMKIPPVKLQVNNSAKGYRICLDGIGGIFVRNNTEFVSNAREIWYGRKINYRLTKGDLRDLEYLLGEISPFDSFKEGQFTALASMLAAKKHSVCIMPTGSGKSLIYYIASILQPLPLFIVAPTDILIQDQIRNLKMFHHIDNIAHLQLTSENNFSNYKIQNCLNYLTPMTLQNPHLLLKFRHINKGTALFGLCEETITPGPLLSYIVLDEIHCLSNWGHDFRPEYLMLSKYMNKFLDQITFLGFTATANYTVVEDVQRQLGIPQENFYSPIAFKKNNISYDYRCVHSTREMLAMIGEIAQQLIARNERTLIFTKNDALSLKVADVVGYEADVFSSGNPDAYHHFVDGKCKVLIASEDLGIGVNFPHINNIIHFGLPLSKSEYVQEVGRAGRASEQVKSYVIYLANDKNNVPDRLLNRSTAVDDIPSLLAKIDNDFSDAYKKLTNDCPTKDILYDRLIALYQEFVSAARVSHVKSYTLDEIETAKQQLYMLYTVGYIHDWYAYRRSEKINGIDVRIDINSSDPHSYESNPKKMFNRMKNRLRDYFEAMGNNRESAARADRASTPEEIIRVYVDWYYSKYLYHQNEQFLDLYEFILRNSSSDSEKITSEMKDYFVLPFIKLKSDEETYGEMSLKELANKAIAGMDRSSIANIERINSNRYSHRLDFLLFCVNLRYNGQFERSRLERVLTNSTSADKKDIAASFAKLYKLCEVNGRLAIINYIEESGRIFELEPYSFLHGLYSEIPRDLIFYGVMAQAANKYFEISRRQHSVR